MIRVKMFTFSPIAENTYLLIAPNGDTAIIDPGCYTGDENETLEDYITTQKLNPVLLLQTHCHLDHVFGTKWVSEQYHLLPHLHRNEEQMMDMAPASGMMWNLPFSGYKGDKIWLEEGQVIKLGVGSLKVLFAPGHSPGHVCFYNEADGYVIGGDVLFAGSIGRTDLPGGNFKVLIESIRTQLLVLPDETKIYPGHGPATTVGKEKLHNPFLQQE